VTTPTEALARARGLDPTAERFIVRLWDGFDGEWSDVSQPLSAAAAMVAWAKRTNNGTRATSHREVDYYAIFPSTTTMRFSHDGVGSQTGRTCAGSWQPPASPRGSR
jgi:hypothetical protein